MTDRSAPTERFSDRVSDYVLARPPYAPEIIDCLATGGALPSAARVADVGAGTGIASRLFVDAGCDVVAVEPNAAMRGAAERHLARRHFAALAGTGEATGLADGAFDLVTVAQALHWMDIAACRREFRRILRPGGAVAVIYNSRRHEASGFMRGYEALVRRFSVDYEHVRHECLGTDAFARLFGGDDYHYARFPNPQRADWCACLARARSSSYLPAESSPDYPAMAAALRKLFDAHAGGGDVTFHYVTELYWARVPD